MAGFWVCFGPVQTEHHRALVQFPVLFPHLLEGSSSPGLWCLLWLGFQQHKAVGEALPVLFGAQK